ncbi:uncharacterized protein LOC120341196 [Styela clava]
MEYFWKSVLLCVMSLIVVMEASYSNIDSCKKIPPARRIECGWPGIRRASCEAKGCCYDSRYMKSLWCFKKEEHTQDSDLTEVETEGSVLRTCAVASSDRVDCGWPSIKKVICENRGCCYSEQIKNSYWCFQPATLFIQPIMQYVMKCVSTCTALSWRRTVTLGSTCKTDSRCWRKKHGILGSICMTLCKSNSTVKEYIKNVSSCLGLSNAIRRKTSRKCEVDISCWTKMHGKEVGRCFAKYSTSVGGRESIIEDLGQVARQPEIQMPLLSLKPAVEKNVSSNKDWLIHRDPNQQNSSFEVQVSVISITDLTEDEDTEPWWNRA